MVSLNQVWLFQQVVSRGLAFIRGNFHFGEFWELQGWMHRPREGWVEPPSTNSPVCCSTSPRGTSEPWGNVPCSPGTSPGLGTALPLLPHQAQPTAPAGDALHPWHSSNTAWAQGPRAGWPWTVTMGRVTTDTVTTGRWPWAGWPQRVTMGRATTGLGTTGQSTWALAVLYQQPFSPPGVCGTMDPTQRAGNNEEGTTFLFEWPFYTVPNKNSSNNHRCAQRGPSGKENAFLWTKKSSHLKGLTT